MSSHMAMIINTLPPVKLSPYHPLVYKGQSGDFSVTNYQEKLFFVKIQSLFYSKNTVTFL